MRFGPGDEGSLTYANVRRRLEAARGRLGLRRVLAVTPELGARGDSAGALQLGARAYDLEADRAEIARALAGTPAASPLFVGHDGVPYKRAYAAVGEPGEVAGLVAVEGSADYPAILAAFRRSMILAGIVAALGVLLLTAWIARRISGPITRLRRRRRASDMAISTRPCRSKPATRSVFSRRLSRRRGPRSRHATKGRR